MPDPSLSVRPRASRSPAGWRDLAASIASMATAAVLFVPWRPASFHSDPDLSWQLVLHDGFIRNIRYGSELVFTFGPWGFAYAGYDPRTFPWALGGYLLVALAFATGASWLARTSPARILFSLILVALATVPAGPYSSDIRFLALTALLVAIDATGEPVPLPLSILLGAAAAFAGLVKFSFLAANTAVLFLGAAGRLRRGVPTIAIAALAFTPLFWLAAGQRLSDFPPFVAHSWQVASGYGEAMSLTFPWPEDRLYLAAYLIASLALIIVLAIALIPKRGLSGAAPTASAAALLLIVLKAGFGRQDGHDLIAFAVLALLALAVAPALVMTAKRSSVRLAAVLVVIVSIGLLADSFEGRQNDSLPAGWSRFALDQVEGAASLAIHGQSALEAEREQLFADIRRRNPVRIPPGAVDVYPTNQAIVLADGRPPARRPVFQSYSAYTSELLRLNAVHVRSGQPDAILFEIAPIDHRLPSLDDSLSWPELLARYRPGADSGGFLVLERRPVPRSIAWGRPVVLRTGAGRRLQIPRLGDPLWAQIEISMSAAGQLVAALFKTPAIWARIGTADGRVHRVRVVRAIAAAGFILSPVIERRGAFAALADGRPNPADETTFIEIERGEYAWCYRPEISISFRPLRITASTTGIADGPRNREPQPPSPR
jgi:hypothetical protein